MKNGPMKYVLLDRSGIGDKVSSWAQDKPFLSAVQLIPILPQPLKQIADAYLRAVRKRFEQLQAKCENTRRGNHDHPAMRDLRHPAIYASGAASR
jgi:hypothetical protein